MRSFTAPGRVRPAPMRTGRLRPPSAPTARTPPRPVRRHRRRTPAARKPSARKPSAERALVSQVAVGLRSVRAPAPRVARVKGLRPWRRVPRRRGASVRARLGKVSCLPTSPPVQLRRAPPHRSRHRPGRPCPAGACPLPAARRKGRRHLPPARRPRPRPRFRHRQRANTSPDRANKAPGKARRDQLERDNPVPRPPHFHPAHSVLPCPPRRVALIRPPCRAIRPPPQPLPARALPPLAPARQLCHAGQQRALQDPRRAGQPCIRRHRLRLRRTGRSLSAPAIPAGSFPVLPPQAPPSVHPWRVPGEHIPP